MVSFIFDVIALFVSSNVIL